MHELDPAFIEFSHRKEFKECAKIMGYSDPLIVQSMYIFKQPKCGGKVDSHQDSTFLYSNPNTTGKKKSEIKKKKKIKYNEI